MTSGNRIREHVDITEFVARLKGYGRDNVACSSHTLFRLSQKQRELFTCDTLRDILFGEAPVLVGIQNNGCYATFYKYKHKSRRIIRIVLDLKADRADIVIFYVIDEQNLPVIK